MADPGSVSVSLSGLSISVIIILLSPFYDLHPGCWSSVSPRNYYTPTVPGREEGRNGQSLGLWTEGVSEGGGGGGNKDHNQLEVGEMMESSSHSSFYTMKGTCNE